MKTRMQDLKISIIRPFRTNIGDYAILKGTISALTKLHLAPKYAFDPEPVLSKNFFESYNISPIYTLPTKIEKILTENRENLFLYFPPLFSFPTEIYKLKKISKEIDILFHIGGSRFGCGFTPNGIAEILNAYSKKRILNAELIIGGVSIEVESCNPFYKSIYKLFIKNVNHIFVRDNISKENLITLGIPSQQISLILDFAFWMHPIESKKTQYIKESIKIQSSGQKIIAISPRIFDLKENNRVFREKYFSQLIKLIEDLHRKNFFVVLLPTSNIPITFTPPYNQDDSSLCWEIKTKLDFNVPIIETSQLEPEEIIEILKIFQGIIASRMHAAIFGTLANIPTIHIYNSQKGLGLFATFFQNEIPLFSMQEFLEKNAIDLIIKELIKNLEENKRTFLKRIEIYRNESLMKIQNVFNNLKMD